MVFSYSVQWTTIRSDSLFISPNPSEQPCCRILTRKDQIHGQRVSTTLTIQMTLARGCERQRIWKTDKVLWMHWLIDSESLLPGLHQTSGLSMNAESKA